MLSKAKIKYIRSLGQKKNRQQERVFVAEGPKVVGELLKSRPAKLIVHTSVWKKTDFAADEHLEVTEEELRKTSFLQHPQEVLAIFPMFEGATPALAVNDLSLALDGVQDPGNLGTIIRIADWFGISQIYCSTDTADVYNPKVIQATMGSIARVHVSYTDLKELIDSLPEDFPVYGTFLGGNNIYHEALSEKGLVVMGNEGNGISPEIREKINRKLLIPNFPEGRETAESLNVAIATAITCSEFRRNK
ncbi:RNA methyltransferase [Prevotella sp. KH2C16]|uniref:RNA methyltransferase n=1 Tax=Prevotella sp. KH2C16 TaxID=1855325 RepID=UPI0008E41754|nr:RNA methyltransferase [Prevotella sp. KH2C16]SFF94443.1 RNA methyltransferase, TrmH family [Prevotella sp. KH2C16]